MVGIWVFRLVEWAQHRCAAPVYYYTSSTPVLRTGDLALVNSSGAHAPELPTYQISVRRVPRSIYTSDAARINHIIALCQVHIAMPLYKL